MIILYINIIVIYIYQLIWYNRYLLLVYISTYGYEYPKPLNDIVIVHNYLILINIVWI